MIPSRHLANYSHLQPALCWVLTGDGSEWTEDTEISTAKNMARYLDQASEHYGSLQNNQPLSRHLIRTCQCWCWRIGVNTSAGEAEKEADAGADQEITAEAPVTLLSSAPGPWPGLD